MARTRGAKSSSPSNRKKSLRKEPSPGSAPEPSPSRPNPPPVKPVPPKPPARLYLTRSGGRPLQKKPRVESLEPIDLTEQSPEPSPISSPVQTPVPSPVPSPSPLPVPSSGTISGARKKNLRSLKRRFPSPKFKLKQLWKKMRPELAQSFQLLRRYHMEHLLAPRDFFYPRIATDFYQSMTTKEVRNPTLIHFTIDGRHGILGARHIAEALQIPFEPTQFDNFRAWANPTELEMVRTFQRSCKSITSAEGGASSKGSQEEASESRLHSPPLPKAAMPNFGASGIPSEPQLERKRICREPFTLDKWNNMTAYKVDQPGQPQPAARRASPRHIPEGITVAAPAIPRVPPAAPTSSQPSTSAEPRMVIPISEYRELCRALGTLTASQSNLAQEMAAIRACQEQMLASQAQQAAILRQLQVHFDLHKL
ncbi:hypothetical protein CK203_093173 [Vitis vinifera]|uniref:Uncharacterized protein n=1 Tax=Vitis vinifera TaxID=29760 RepID=A0A438D6L1_VITVI|nr:hypothetical protein CK203_093173 [Vitis vinifera]